MARVRLAILLAALASAEGCDRTSVAPAVTTPTGWTTATVSACCTVALPAGATLTALSDPVDDPTYRIAGTDFDGLMTITGMGASLPRQTAGTDYFQQQVSIDGRKALTASYNATDGSALAERRYLVWSFKGDNDGRGLNLILSMSCRGAGCAVFEPMYASLKRI